MATYIAPGVYTKIQDLSQYAVASTTSSCGMVGAARKGPVSGMKNLDGSYNVPQLITSQSEFVSMFGTPTPEEYGPYAALLYLTEGNALYYARVANINPAFKRDNEYEDALIVGNTYKVVGPIYAGTVTFSNTESGTTAVDVGDTYLVPSAGITTISGSVGGAFAVSHNVRYAARAWGYTAKDGTDLSFVAASPGSWGNNVGFKISNVAADSYILDVYYRNNGVEEKVESFYSLNIDRTSKNYWITAVNSMSEYIRIYTPNDSVMQAQPFQVQNDSVTYLGGLVSDDDSAVIESNVLSYFGATSDNALRGEVEDYKNPTCWKSYNSENPQAYAIVGSDGATPTDADAIGINVDTGGAGVSASSGLYAFFDKEIIEIDMLGAPGYDTLEVITAIQTICDHRQDCLGIINPPLGFNANEAINWHNGYMTGSQSGTQSQRITSNTMACYWPWIELYDQYNKQNMWNPPCGFVMKQIAYNDAVSECWMAPAGIRRGYITEALRTEFSVSTGQREAMYNTSQGNAINPIVNLPLDGITIYGQRTMQRTASSLCEIAVRRLLFYCTRTLSRSVRHLLFEKNDKVLWNQFLSVVSPFIQNLKSRRAVTDFRVICDKSTNTNYRMNNGEMHGYVMMIPTRTAEKIVMNFCLFAHGSTMEAPVIDN